MRADCLYTVISSGPTLDNEYGKPLPFYCVSKRSEQLGQKVLLSDFLLNVRQSLCFCTDVIHKQ